MEGFAFIGAFLVIWIILMLVAIGINITSYVLGSLGTYKIAKRRGIHNPWLAWLPVGQGWILGSISDHYQYIVQGKTRNYRKVLMWLEIGLYGLSIVLSLVSVATSVGTTMGAVMESEAMMVSSALGMAGVSMIMSFVTIAASITFSVFAYICYYDLFRSCSPKNAVLYLVLSILVGITMPFFIFACRNSDEGMPPKIRNTIDV